MNIIEKLTGFPGVRFLNKRTTDDLGTQLVFECCESDRARKLLEATEVDYSIKGGLLRVNLNESEDFDYDEYYSNLINRCHCPHCMNKFTLTYLPDEDIAVCDECGFEGKPIQQYDGSFEFKDLVEESINEEKYRPIDSIIDCEYDDSGKPWSEVKKEIINKYKKKGYRDVEVVRTRSDTRGLRCYYVHGYKIDDSKEEDLKEGMFDYDDNSFFTRDDLDEFVDALQDEIRDINFERAYFEPGNILEVDWEYQFEENTTKVKVDMRRIRSPRDLQKAYLPIVKNMILDKAEQIDEENDSYESGLEDIDKTADSLGESINESVNPAETIVRGIIDYINDDIKKGLVDDVNAEVQDVVKNKFIEWNGEDLMNLARYLDRDDINDDFIYAVYDTLVDYIEDKINLT